jgi:hypothetical protein
VSSLALLAVGAGAGLWKYRQSTAARLRPLVESRRIDTPAEAPAAGPLGPAAREVLERKADLGLSETQLGRLHALEEEWRRSIGPLEREVREAEADLQGFMDQAGRAGRGSLAEIQRRAAAQGELFAAYRQQRAAHVAAVRKVLTEEQRARWMAMAAPQRTGEKR